MIETTVKIPAELFALAQHCHFEGTYDVGELSMGPDDYTFAEPIAWGVDITNTGSAFLVEGLASGVGVCACSRCLEDVRHGFNGSIEGYFLIGDSASSEEGEDDLEDDEFEVLPEDHVLDLAPLIEAALMVDAPDMPLCREDCAGLCQQCGANLNEGPCSCGEDPDLAAFERQANPFAALADYTFE